MKNQSAELNEKQGNWEANSLGTKAGVLQWASFAVQGQDISFLMNYAIEKASHISGLNLSPQTSPLHLCQTPGRLEKLPLLNRLQTFPLPTFVLSVSILAPRTSFFLDLHLSDLTYFFMDHLRCCFQETFPDPSILRHLFIKENCM